MSCKNCTCKSKKQIENILKDIVDSTDSWIIMGLDASDIEEIATGLIDN